MEGELEGWGAEAKGSWKRRELYGKGGELEVT